MRAARLPRSPASTQLCSNCNRSCVPCKWHRNRLRSARCDWRVNSPLLRTELALRSVRQLLRASPVGPTAIVTLCAEVPAWSTPRMLALRCAERGTWRCSHSPLVAGYTRRPSHTDVGRCVAKCTRLRAHSHTKGALDVGSMLPKAPITSALVSRDVPSSQNAPTATER